MHNVMKSSNINIDNFIDEQTKIDKSRNRPHVEHGVANRNNFTFTTGMVSNPHSPAANVITEHEIKESQQEADMSGNITKTELEALLRANKSEVDVVAANIQKEMAEWREQQNAQMTEVNKTLSILNVKMDERFENQKQSSTRIQWMVGIAIAAAALVPAYFGMVKSEPAPMQQPTIVYVQQPAPAVQATPPQVQPAPQPVPQEPTPEPQKAPATKQ